jgi:hypothetical protein
VGDSDDEKLKDVEILVPVEMRLLNAQVHISLTKVQTVTTLDMTSTRAHAEIEIANAKFAVPAREQTRRTYAVAAVLVVGFAVMAFNPAVAVSIAVAVSVMAGVTALPGVIDKLKKPTE